MELVCVVEMETSGGKFLEGQRKGRAFCTAAKRLRLLAASV